MKRGPYRKGHCLAGHKMTRANTYKDTDGYKRCRICRNERQATYRKEHSHSGDNANRAA